jgi:lysophospholipase L1-like esterase
VSEPPGHAVAFLCAGLLAACGSPSSGALSNAKAPWTAPAPTPQDWARFTQLRIVFGHQSVGYNILAGVTSLARERQTALTITETKSPLTSPGIHHFKVGRNGEPQSKLADFQTSLQGGLGQSADIALLKLCFIDFEMSRDARDLARSYIAELDQLAREYPNTVFLPATAPLTTVQTGPKAWIKRLLGQAPAGYTSNARRAQFNQVLRQHYAGQPLFDIAALESEGGRSGVDYGNSRLETLDPALTSDGGHLNDEGQHLIGGALVHILAGIQRR